MSKNLLSLQRFQDLPNSWDRRSLRNFPILLNLTGRLSENLQLELNPLLSSTTPKDKTTLKDMMTPKDSTILMDSTILKDRTILKHRMNPKDKTSLLPRDLVAAKSSKLHPPPAWHRLLSCQYQAFSQDMMGRNLWAEL